MRWAGVQCGDGQRERSRHALDEIVGRPAAAASVAGQVVRDHIVAAAQRDESGQIIDLDTARIRRRPVLAGVSSEYQIAA